MDSPTSGTLAGSGSFRCEECGHAMVLAASDALEPCPRCGAERWTRATLGDLQTASADVGETADEPAHDLAEAARAGITESGQYLAYDDGARLCVTPLVREWTRVGRSLAADVRFDDPTVSRRHALIVRQPDGVRVLDDRSLNGVFVNGARVEWRTLEDGDEILVGRHRLLFLDVVAVEPASAPEAGTPAGAGAAG